MKKRLVQIIMIMIIGLTCKKPVNDIPASLTVNPPSKEVDANQGSFTINVTSTVTWTANCDKSWVTIDPSQGEGNSTIKATYQTNTLSTNRTATITVTGNGVADKAIIINQLGIQPILTVTPTNISVAAVASSTTINITSNLTWNATSNQTWCTLAQSSGTGIATLTVNLQSNTNQSQRTAIITFTANGVTNQTVQITQAELVPILTVLPSSQTVNSTQGTATYTITSNIAWTATNAQNWCIIANPSGVNNGSLIVNYDPNTTAGNRVATIIISGSGVSNQSVTLIQTNLIPTLSVAPLNRDVAPASGSTTFDITSNTSWTAQSDKTWCTISNATGTGNATLNVNYEVNTTFSSRIATITISVSGLAPKTVTVTQSNVIPTLSITPINQNVTSIAGSTTFDIASNTSWTAQSDQTWCTITNAIGTGNATLKVNYEVNTIAQRVANITIVVNGLPNKVVTVTQAAVITWTATSFPTNLYGNWYSDFDGSYQWNISGSTTIRTYNRSFTVLSTFGFAGTEYEYKVITTEGGRWHVFFFKNISSSHMQATFTNCPSSPIGFATEAEALAATSGYNQYCNGNHK